LKKDAIKLVLLATSTPDHLLPPTAPLVAHRLGLGEAGGIDMAGACGGFLYALTLADSYVRTRDEAVLVIAANLLSRRIRPDDRGTNALFADAAGAVVLAPAANDSSGIVAAKLAADGSGYGLIHIPGGGSRKPFGGLNDVAETLMVMSDGQAVYGAAVDMMVRSAAAALSRARISAADITYFVPHQANARMMRTVAHKLGIPETKMLSTVARYGNSSAATIPLTLSASSPAPGYRTGDVILMTAAGAGLTGGAAVLRW
jgi:3-oxoacyl-[acyl-carrier-protein] synthase-3